MSNIMEWLRVPFQHKLKILTAIAAFIIFMYFFFPFNDLGDLVSGKVAELTQGNVVVSFENLDISLLPTPGLSLTKATVETAFTGALSADSLVVAPNLMGLLAFKPGFNAHASGFMGGDFGLATRGGDKTKTGALKQKVAVTLDSISLEDAFKAAQQTVPVKGRITGDATADIDPSFGEQPQGKISISSKDFKITEGVLNIPYEGAQLPVNLPLLDLKNLVFDAGMDKGVLTINKAVIGTPTSDINIQATGRIDFKLQATGNQVVPVMGGYNLNLKIQVQEAGKTKLGTYLGFLTGYKTSENTYSVIVSAPNTFSPPTMVKGP